MTPFHLSHYSSKFITLPLHGRKICTVISVSVLVFLFFPFTHVLAIQCKELLRHSFLYLSYKLSLFCSESIDMFQNTRCLLQLFIQAEFFFFKTRKVVFLKKSLILITSTSSATKCNTKIRFLKKKKKKSLFPVAGECCEVTDQACAS